MRYEFPCGGFADCFGDDFTQRYCEYEFCDYCNHAKAHVEYYEKHIKIKIEILPQRDGEKNESFINAIKDDNKEILE
jgi:hypothetical protein